jgi:hypothetical protein
MTLWFRRPSPATPSPLPPAPVAVAPGTPYFIRAWTEDFYISGFVRGPERLSDVLNAREPLTVDEPKLQALHSSGWPTHPEGTVVMDPFDFDIVLGQALDPAGAAERLARRIHKVRYPVLIEGPTIEILGVIHLFAGNAPEYAAHRGGHLFIPITEPSVRYQGRLVSDGHTDVVLVNRHAVRTIRQLDSPQPH